MMDAVSAAIAAVTARVPARDLSRAAEALSIRYRGDEDGRESSARALTDAERAAYLLVRAPATYAAVSAVLEELADRCPQLAARRLLDLGAGPGVGLWAALAHRPELTHATLIERDRGFIALGREILDASGLAHDRTIDWHAGDVREVLRDVPDAHDADDQRDPRGRDDHHGQVSLATSDAATCGDAARHVADLVLMSYSLGELPADARDRAIDAAWRATAGVLMLIEPGTPRHFEVVLAARTRLLQLGATIAAPCPHHGACPMALAGDWCHVSARLARSRQHRQLKDARLAYEDEKFSYLIAARDPATLAAPAAARIVRHPRIEKGRVTLTLCTRDGLSAEPIGRRDPDTWRAARKARWGDVWP